MILTSHAGHNPDGLKGSGAYGLISESTEARKVNAEVIRLLKAKGHTVYDCTINDAKNQSDILNKIVNKCNSYKDTELNISIHFNAGANDKKGNNVSTGTEVLIYSDNSKAKPYANRILDEIDNLGFKNRGIKLRPNLAVLKRTSKPTLLIECCFVDDKDDIDLYNYKTMAQAIVSGILGMHIEEPIINIPTPIEAINKKNFTNAEFIEYIGNLANKDMQKSGILASLTVAQAIKESAWGQSELAQNANALFGIKNNSDWNGRIYSKATGECYDGKNYVTIVATFRAYDTWKESITDHSVYLTTRMIGNKRRYEKVIGETDYKKACFEVKASGYATGLEYAEGLIKLIEQHNLTRFDTKSNAPTPTTPQLKYKVGDKVNYTSYYASSVSSIDKAVIKSGSGTITRVLTNGVRNPYLINEGKIGWCNDGDISGYVGETNNTTPTPKFPYIVKVIANALNIRKEPNSDGTVVGQIKDKGKYTIIDEYNGYGRLKSGAGWIHLDFTEKV